METLFDTSAFAPGKRAAAWRDALCGNYVTVDSKVYDQDNYFGHIKQSSFGGINISQTLACAQVIERTRRHLGHLEKDCLYLQMPKTGIISVTQRGREVTTCPDTGSVYSASEPYRLEGVGVSEAIYAEIPTELLVAKLHGRALPMNHQFNTRNGMGRVLSVFCDTIIKESSKLTVTERTCLGDELVGLLSLLVANGETEEELANSSLRQARISAVKRHIEANLSDPLLSLARIARDNDISVRYLHRLFESEDISISDWIWAKRLERCHKALISALPGTRVTDIAFANGFSSSSHFSASFKRRFGIRPSELTGQQCKL